MGLAERIAQNAPRTWSYVTAPVYSQRLSTKYGVQTYVARDLVGVRREVIDFTPTKIQFHGKTLYKVSIALEDVL